LGTVSANTHGLSFQHEEGFMSQDQRAPQAGGLFADCFQAFFAAVPNMQTMGAGMPSAEPLLKGVARYNLEVMGLVNRRAQAWLETPSRLAQCRAPKDVFELQSQFWQIAVHDYSEATQRMTSVIAACAPAAWDAALSKSADQPPRDYITFPEPAPNGRADAERKAA
jgi:hypothetical protein